MPGFTYVPSAGGQKRMYWKMSIDLSYPLVQSMGHHDPLDGFVTYSRSRLLQMLYLKNQCSRTSVGKLPTLAAICEGKDWATDDPLGIGDLLCSAYKVAQLVIDGYFSQTGLLAALLDSSMRGLKFCVVDEPSC